MGLLTVDNLPMAGSQVRPILERLDNWYERHLQTRGTKPAQFLIHPDDMPRFRRAVLALPSVADPTTTQTTYRGIPVKTMAVSKAEFMKKLKEMLKSKSSAEIIDTLALH